MFKASIKMIGVKETIADLEKLKRESLPRVIAKSLTKTAMKVREEVKNEMRKVFNNPTPYTMGSLYLQGATNTNWEAVVWFKDDAGKGTPASKYLWPEVHGGERQLKKFEKALARKGYLPPGWYAVPGSGAKLNQYGNISAGQITQVLTALNSLPGRPTIGGYETPIRKKNQNVKAYFAIRPYAKSHLAPGVYQRVSGNTLKCILVFTQDRPDYKTRLPFNDIAQKVVDETLERTLVEELNKTMQGAWK